MDQYSLCSFLKEMKPKTKAKKTLHNDENLKEKTVSEILGAAKTCDRSLPSVGMDVMTDNVLAY